jgi:F-box interacting protein
MHARQFGIKVPPILFSSPESRVVNIRQCHCIRVELFESATWKWKLLDEVKLPHEESLHCMTKVSVNGSLHWLTWKRNVFVFNVKRESHCLFPLPLPTSEGNENKDVKLTEYKGKLTMTCIDRERNFMEVWIMKDHDRKQ